MILRGVVVEGYADSKGVRDPLEILIDDCLKRLGRRKRKMMAKKKKVEKNELDDWERRESKEGKSVLEERGRMGGKIKS